ncbi:MAG: hypothetical protein DRR04_09335 [Gammaproteobacteria bacterium]|nr:MAG: hypothetical protein DRR04_09335 [Gammaproteobacteria bacterium]
MQLFMMAIIGIFFGTVYTVISFGNLMIPFLVWIMSVFGFRFLWSIQTPVLPDLFLDRMTMVWLMVVFSVKFMAEKRQFRGPFLLDLMMVINALYLVIGIYIQDMTVFHGWTMSILVPYSAYFFAKNLTTKNKDIRRFLWVLLILVIYYNITSIAEKLGINVLVWPKYILTESRFWGRSSGPFLHAPLFGTIIGMMIPIHLYFIVTVRNWTSKILLFLSLLMGFAGLYFTYTRGSWLAGIMALITVVFLNRRHFLKFILPAVVVAPIVAILFLGIGQDKFMKERVENEDTFGSRLGTFVTAIKVWQDNAILGVGFNQYKNVLDNYIEPLDLPVIGVITVHQFRDNPPHDIYISYLAEHGIVGTLLQGSIYFLILRTFLAKYAWRKKGDYFATYIMPIFGGIFVGYLVGGLAIDYKFFSGVGTLFYSCAGILYGYQREDSGLADNLLRQPTSQVD